MDIEGHAHEYQQGIIPPHSLSPSFVNRSSGASVPAAPQGETSENGFYVPFSVPPFNTSSPGISLSIPFPENHAFPGGSSLMSCDSSQSDLPGFTEFSPLMSGMHAWISQPHPHGPSLSSTSRPRSQTTPSFFPSGAVAARSHPATHGPEPQMTRANLDQSASLARRTSLSTFAAHPLPAQFASGPLHTHHNGFPGQYAMPSHPPPFQNQPSQPYVYHGYHPLEPSPYPPTRYFPLPQHQPLPYFRHQSTMEGSNPSYQQAQRLPLPVPQSSTSSPGPSHAGSYGMQQYLPPHYDSTGHYGLLQQYQPNVYQWYYGPSSSADAFNNGIPMQVQQQYPMNYQRPRTRRQRRDSNFRAQSIDSERLPSPGLGPSSNSIAVTISRNTTSPAAADPPEQSSVQSSPKIDTHELSNKLVASTSRTHDHPPVRRRYHPNPPPNRSEWVMWVGNVPGDATHDELWRFLKYAAPVSSGTENSGGVEDSGVMSIFLISRSNCAFVNYQSEEYLDHAISQFSGCKLRPHDRRCPRLVCRARRKEDDLRAGVGAQRGIGVHTSYVKNMSQKSNEPAVEKTTVSKGRRSNPSTISDPPPAPSASKGEATLKSDTVECVNPKVPTRSPSSYASTSSSFLTRHFPTRFFILKSLTQYDLDLSVERGVWATQKHNETILDQAFRTSKVVILIFSVNRSGEFYGYARMASGILRSNCNISWAPRADSSPCTSSPSSSCVPAHGTPEQCGSPSRQSPRMDTSPSEHRLVETSPFPLLPSSDETEDSPEAASSPEVKSAQERRSASPALDRDPEDPISSDPLPRSSFSYSHTELLVTSQVSDPDASPILRPELGKNSGVPAGARSKDGGVDDPGNLGLPLQPVVEEVHSGSDVEEDIRPAPTAMLPVAMHGHSEVQQREESWGETFKIEWLCTERVPFHRTRHLRNPWNHDREIKVSRDGTELEPVVGQQLIEEWPSLANEAADDDASRRTTGRRVAKPAATPGPAVEPKGVKEEPL